MQLGFSPDQLSWFSSSFRDRTSSETPSEDKLQAGLGRLDAPSGTFLAYSTAPGKVAVDGVRGQRNSPFTKHLLQAMQQSNLRIEDVFKEVRLNVSRETAGTPLESTSLTGFFTFQRGH